MGRRASSKLKIAGGPVGRKRKADSDDSEFEGAAKSKKSAAPKQPKQAGGMLSYLHNNQNPPKAKKTSPKAKAPSAITKALMESVAPAPKKEKTNDVWLDLDSGSDAPKTKAPAPMKKGRPSKKKAETSDDELDEDEIIGPAAGRKPRAATSKPVKYNTLDSDSDGDDMLLDVGKMVKGIDTTSGSVDNSRPLFSASMSRPGSSAGLPKKPTSSRITEIVDEDDTNYSMLAPPTVGKGPAMTAKKTILADDDSEDLLDGFDGPAPISKAPKPKPGPKPPAKAPAKSKAPAKAPAARQPKATSQPPEQKKMPLSPAAKAYAAKKAKQEKFALQAIDDSEDELEKVANEIMDEGEESEEPAVAGRRPARRAAAATATKKKWVISDDEDEDDDDDLETTGVYDDADSED